MNAFGITVKTTKQVFAEVIDSNWDRSMLIIRRIYKRPKKLVIPWTQFLDNWEKAYQLTQTEEILRHGSIKTM